uniref:RING-type domain-containing protein n=1 Tax=Eutreptiella gymnastica TaxID=73025 RepID=A0A7S4LEC4_9EUGL
MLCALEEYEWEDDLDSDEESNPDPVASAREVIVIDDESDEDKEAEEDKVAQEEALLADDALIKKFGTCCICMAKASNALLTPCYHGFCEPCVIKWFQSSARRMCPLCKRRALTRINNYGVPGEFRIVQLDTMRVLYNSIGHTQNPRSRVYNTAMCAKEKRQLHRHHFPSRTDATYTAIECCTVGSIPDTVKWWRDHKDALTAQVMEWVRRDLHVLMGSADVDFVADLVMGLCSKVPLMCTQATAFLADYVGARSQHFLYELYMYLRSWSEQGKTLIAITEYDRRLQLQPWSCVFKDARVEKTISDVAAPSKTLAGQQKSDCSERRTRTLKTGAHSLSGAGGSRDGVQGSHRDDNGERNMDAGTGTDTDDGYQGRDRDGGRVMNQDAATSWWTGKRRDRDRDGDRCAGSAGDRTYPGLGRDGDADHNGHGDGEGCGQRCGDPRESRHLGKAGADSAEVGMAERPKAQCNAGNTGVWNLGNGKKVSIRKQPKKRKADDVDDASLATKRVACSLLAHTVED